MPSIFLTGFMGTGKSTIGKLLADILNYRFFDSDALIEEKTGLSIPDIFKQFDEPYFRNLEKSVLNELARLDRCVISTGGGIVLDPENMQLMHTSGVVVCLKARPEEILKRVLKADNRPLLNVADPAAAIGQKLQERCKLNEGDLILDTSDITPDQAVKRIVSFLTPSDIVYTVQVNLRENPYVIHIGSNLLDRLGHLLSSVYPQGKLLIVSNPSVHGLWGKRLEKALKGMPFEFSWAIIPDGEEYKNLETLEQLYDAAVDFRLDRKSLILAFGGGVIGDMAGFMAATYMRGVPFVQIPTTLLAQVDSSIGGKTAVNHKSGKNLIGSFHQPVLVVSDTSLLATLPERELSNGLAEMIKHGVILDETYFNFLEQNIHSIRLLEQKVLPKALEGSCRIKAVVVEQDEKEESLRALLNYGHTIGHGIETATDYQVFRHGEAVALGMEGAAVIAQAFGLFSEEDRTRQNKMLKQAGLPTEYPNIDSEAVLKAITSDKKMKNGRLHFILPEKIGRALISRDVTTEHIRGALKFLSNQ